MAQGSSPLLVHSVYYGSLSLVHFIAVYLFFCKSPSASKLFKDADTCIGREERLYLMPLLLLTIYPLALIPLLLFCIFRDLNVSDYSVLIIMFPGQT